MLAFPGDFNPAIDRYDARSAARLFRCLWPSSDVARACSRVFSESVRVAHAAADACWGVTLFRDKCRLNVGQVEVLTLSGDHVAFLIRAPLDFEPAMPGEVTLGTKPVYPAVPVPSGIVFVAPEHIPALSDAVRDAHHAYINAAASFKRNSPFKNSFSPGVLEHLEVTLGYPLPRPSYLPPEAGRARVQPLPDELDTSEPIFEGARYQVTVNAYERNPRARRDCIAAHGTDCAVCGFSFRKVYGEVADDLIHVHHLRPLSEIGKQYEVDPVADLRPVCPNCHAVLHRRVPAYSIAEVRSFLR